ncbi:HERC5_2 [Blepharisma stoltei]|uniref:RCC1-like domain-containing protein n=1 Tax=Blepharisma stoltei TaxID=1481888 RepID=A0AAU9IRS6_9CILI|nr:unnamed protein product [Blepharisma stoltei]
MAFWKALWCSRDKEVSVTETTRLLPRLEDNRIVSKQESPFVVFAYGIAPPQLHLRRIPTEFTRVGIAKIACGSEHFLMLTENNFVLAAGNNAYGQCGRDPQRPIENPISDESAIIQESPTNLRLSAFNIENHRVVDIAAGSYHSLVLVHPQGLRQDAVSRVMAFGHELGCGFFDKQHRHLPTEIELGQSYSMETVSKIFAGHMRSAVLLESGKLLMWGEWFNGAKQRQMREIKLSLKSNDRCKKVSIGKMHALMVTEQGKLYSWGDNTYGELGTGRTIKNKNSPNLVPFFQNMTILDCAAGGRHSLVLEETGRVFAFGDNSEGQCAIDANRTYEPIQIETVGMLGEDSSKARFIYAGDAHSALLSSEGDLFAWGDNSACRLGISSTSSVFRPTLVDDIMGRNICAVGLGGFFSVCIIGPHQFSLVGRNENMIKVQTIFNEMLQKRINEGEAHEN